MNGEQQMKLHLTEKTSVFYLDETKNKQIHTQLKMPDETPVSTVLMSDEKTYEAVYYSSKRPSGILPPAVRWISKTRRSIIFERPPHTVPITFTYFTRDGQKLQARIDIPLPWTVYGANIDNDGVPWKVFLYGSKKEVSNVRDKVFFLPLPNLYSDGRFCLPDVHSLLMPDQRLTIADTINLTYLSVWQSNFNTDIEEVVVAHLESERPVNLFHPKGTTFFFDSDTPTTDSASLTLALLKSWSKASLNDVLLWDDWLHATRIRTIMGLLDQSDPLYTTNYHSMTHLATSIEAMAHKTKMQNTDQP